MKSATYILLFVPLLFFAFFPVNAVMAGGSLYLAPSEGTFFVGNTFDISVFVNTGGNDINAVQADLKFDPKKIQVASPTAGKSFISVWIAQPNYSNVDGNISFRGGIPSPGINTTAGLVSTITFRAITPGTTSITFADSSKMLLNDGQGTNILTSLSRGVYTITIPPPEGPKVYSSTHPDQNKWYKNNNPTFSWERESDVSDFSYSFDQDSYGTPDNNSEGDYTSVSYSDVRDGLWYFHVKAKKGNIWGGTSHYLVQIDSTPPATFTPIIDPSAKTTEKQPLVSFFTTDALSGIDHYELKYINVTLENEDKATGFFIEASSPYRLPSLEPGRYIVVVRAFDAAGNYQETASKIQIFQGKIFFADEGINFFGIIVSWTIIFIFLTLLLLIVTILLIYIIKKYRDAAIKKKKELAKMEEDLANRKNYPPLSL